MFLEDNAEWIPIEIDGEEFEVLEYSIDLTISKSAIYPRTNIALLEKTLGVTVIEIRHDSFLIESGDKANVQVILLRPG